jgi:FkbM family methyltransferase
MSTESNSVPPSAPTDRQLERLRREVAEFRRAAESWKKKAGEQEQKASQKSRRVLSADVLQQILPLRAQTLAARAAIPSRAAREAVLRAESPAYAAAAARGPARWGEFVHPMRVDGLAWWMPVVKPGRPRPEAWIEKQRFPYRILTQTRELSVGGIMLDLGGNIGLTSIPRVILGDVVAAYCAEPDPLNYACLVGNVVDNGLQGMVMPDWLAVGDRDGTVVLSRGRAAGSHHVLAGDAPADGVRVGPIDPPLRDGERVEVPCLTVDSWIARLRIDPDAITFVKVDVQGFELRVLRGASVLLAKRHVAWQLEMAPRTLEEAGTSVGDVCAALQQHFTHFIDLNRAIDGARHRPIAALTGALDYLTGAESKTDVLVYCAAAT